MLASKQSGLWSDGGCVAEDTRILCFPVHGYLAPTVKPAPRPLLEPPAMVTAGNFKSPRRRRRSSLCRVLFYH